MSLVELEEATGLAKESLRLTHLRMVQGGSFSVQSGAASAEISQTILDPIDRESSRCQREKLAEYLKSEGRWTALEW
jgi:hypothetical protein